MTQTLNEITESQMKQLEEINIFFIRVDVVFRNLVCRMQKKVTEVKFHMKTLMQENEFSGQKTRARREKRIEQERAKLD